MGFKSDIEIAQECEMLPITQIVINFCFVLTVLLQIFVVNTYGKVSEQKPVTAGDLHAEGAMTALLKDAFGTPPLYFSARTVATITTALG